MRLAIFGGGSIGQRHAENARALGHVVDIYDVDRSRGALPATFASADAAMICTPAETHASVARALLFARGYHGPLFVEKPLCLEAKDEDLFLTWPHPVQMVGYNWRFHPHVAPLLDLAAARVHLDCRTDMRSWPGHGYASPIFECSHEIDLACAWLGELRGGPHGGSLDGGRGAWLELQHERGSSVIDLRWQTEGRRTYTAHMADGSYVLLRPSTAPTSGSLAESYRLELEHFLACIEARRPGGCSFAEGVIVAALCRYVEAHL